MAPLKSLDERALGVIFKYGLQYLWQQLRQNSFEFRLSSQWLLRKSWQDVLSIRLTFEQSGYKGRLLIFDAQGFPIRTVVNNELFGTDNLYFWDGLTDRKEAAATGRYILLLEATQSSLPPIIEKKTAVVGW